MIVAADMNGLIAYGGKIPWSEKQDQLRFKALTTGHSVIMGRKTWDDLPPSKLPNRDKYIISSQPKENGVDSFWSTNLISAIQTAARVEKKDIWIIGGEQIYKQAIEYEIPDEIDLTILNYKWVEAIKEGNDKIETKRLPCIPLTYQVISEYPNIHVNHLFHRIYRRRSGRLYLDL